MFGTRNYGEDTYIVRLISEDGINFNEQEVVVAQVKGEKHQNAFIFYDEANKLYRLYYFHLSGQDNFIEEKHSDNITGLAMSPKSIILSDNKNILAAPSIFFRDGRYWLTAETFQETNNVHKWQTLAFVSDNPITGFIPVEETSILVDNDACFFPYIFDNRLIGVYSHRYEDKTWDLYGTTHAFQTKNRIKIEQPVAQLEINQSKQLMASFILPNGKIKNVTADATWATSDNSTITVQKGIITAKKEGTTIITVTYGGVSTTNIIQVVPVKTR
jgi:hypothetical protein